MSPKATSRGRAAFHGDAQHQEMPGDGRSPRRVASMDASLSIGQLTSVIEATSHTVDKSECQVYQSCGRQHMLEN
eukprot:9575502-Prorocentrum_lima.AAC.1